MTPITCLHPPFEKLQSSISDGRLRSIGLPHKPEKPSHMFFTLRKQRCGPLRLHIDFSDVQNVHSVLVESLAHSAHRKNQYVNLLNPTTARGQAQTLQWLVLGRPRAGVPVSGDMKSTMTDFQNRRCREFSSVGLKDHL